MLVLKTSTVKLVDDGSLRISTTCAVPFSLTLYAACSNVTVTTIEHVHKSNNHYTYHTVYIVASYIWESYV